MNGEYKQVGPELEIGKKTKEITSLMIVLYAGRQRMNKESLRSLSMVLRQLQPKDVDESVKNIEVRRSRTGGYGHMRIVKGA